MQRLLDYQADQIELILLNHRVPGRVIEGTVTPRGFIIRFTGTTKSHEWLL
ncbi:MAG: hypothetical protein U0401_34940 [Anaerolineae bacterium]